MESTEVEKRHIVSVYRVISDTVKVREITEMQHAINISYTFVVFWARIISYRLTSNSILVRNTKVLALYGPHKVTTVSAVSIRLETVILQSDATCGIRIDGDDSNAKAPLWQLYGLLRELHNVYSM